MAKLELLKVEIDTEKVYKPTDKLVFKTTFNNQEYLDGDIEFEVIYFGDAYSENHDQKICHDIAGPLEKGKLCFELETNPIDLTKIPIKTLFGLTTILIVCKFKGEQFIRIGYVVDVSYPGIASDKLVDSDDKPLAEDEECVEEEDESEEEEDDESVEIMDDSELEEECDGDECCDEEECDGDECCDEEECDGDECCDEEECDQCDGDECCDDQNLENAIADVLMPGKNREPIPLETPIVSDKDEFEYKGFTMKKSMIEMRLIEKPIIHVFDINWNMKKEDEIVESSENEGNTMDSDLQSKKQKVE